MTALRVGTRGSALALAQARWVAERLGGAEIVVITTSGDRARGIGDKSRWVDTIEAALVAGEIDLAVHSAKDVPADLAPGCELVATPPRARAEDVLVGAAGRSVEAAGLSVGAADRSAGATSAAAAGAALAALPPGARVGTSSLRRRAQLLAARADLEIVELRGNVDTRLRKLDAGDVEAIVLAAAGLERLGIDRAAEVLDFVAAPGQGTLAIEARADDERVRAAVFPLIEEEYHRRCMTRTPSPHSRPNGPPCAYWKRPVTRPWESTRGTARFAGSWGCRTAPPG